MFDTSPEKIRSVAFEARPSAEAGMTLIELVIVLVISAILVGFLAPMTYEAVSAYQASSRGYEALQKIRFALDRIGYEVREVRRDPANSGDYDIFTFSTTSLDFNRSDATRVTIASASPTVTLRYGSNAAATLVDGVDSFSFTYFLSDGVNAATTRSDVAYVHVQLTVTESGITYSGARRIDLRVGQ